MIEAKETLTGNIASSTSLNGTLNKKLEYVEPTTQEKEITPTKEVQEVIPDENIFALSKVKVNAIPNDYIVPSGTKEITNNGSYDVTEYKSVEVATNGVDLNEYMGTEIRNGTTSYSGAARLIKKTPENLTIASGTNGSFMFANMYGLIEISYFDTGAIQNFSFGIYYCSSLITIALLNFQSVNNLSNCFLGCSKMTNLGGFKDLGKGYTTSADENNFSYTLNLSYSTLLTHDSLMNVINNLYDIKSKGCKTQKLVLGSTNIAKLTAEEIAIATNKGWTVS